MFVLPFISILLLGIFLAFLYTAFNAIIYTYRSKKVELYAYMIILAVFLLLPFPKEFKILITFLLLCSVIAKHKIYLSSQN